MKKVILLAIAILLFGMTAFAAKPTNAVPDTTKTKKAGVAKVQYTCPMHHDVLTDKPGKCPKPGCGMTLVKVNPAKKKAAMKM